MPKVFPFLQEHMYPCLFTFKTPSLGRVNNMVSSLVSPAEFVDGQFSPCSFATVLLVDLVDLARPARVLSQQRQTKRESVSNSSQIH